ncbi:hypothetical protein AHFPHNDE_01551 [Pseudomonas sp. MM227]|uniref:hypothetical protein n=1 Tax=unclassified Pseudomonas TaxID=196821 RepID=UPI000F02ECCB|nr:MULTISPECIES: hypothetical protein [unclassified Pseudomonas]MBD8621933.1 hypothetical protein [Pseudomonas sp. CFBP 13727]MBD8732487.1 hypothetical protein [Pseudomonas sp. CFBP 13710]CAI3787879.1 hypothetical protein AHFPHNDE_01551 [Pseudomonas sp. MM227]
MSRNEPTSAQSRRDMRKSLIRLRMEMHRQELRHESRQLVNPLTRLRGLGQSVQTGMGIKHASLWGIAGVTLMGFLTGRGAGNSARAPVVAPVRGPGRLSRLAKVGTLLLPVIKLAMQGSSRRR